MVKLGILSLDHPHSRGNHIPALHYLTKEIKLAAIYNEDYEMAKPYLEAFGAEYCRTRDELLAMDLDAVLITSKNFKHAEDCIAAAAAGKDIFCDKPIAVSVADAVRIREAVEKAGVAFMTTYPVRFNDAVEKIKAMADAGEFGKITAIMATNHGCMYEPGAPDWVKKAAQNGGGCLIDHCVHVADIIRWLTGSEFTDVKAETNHALHDDIDAEDIAVLHGSLENGCLYQIDASWTRRGCDTPWGDVTFRIVGTKASASLDIYNNQRVEVYAGGEEKMLFANNIVREHGEIFHDYWKYKTTGEPMRGARLTDGLRTVELAYAGYASAESGKREPVLRR
ncbi:MAG: Gfo/Idh/MocA family oxidoreductase [Ruthenibacterium sp.]